MAQLIAEHQDQTAHHGTLSPCQSKNCPVSAGVRSSITESRFCAASAGGTEG